MAPPPRPPRGKGTPRPTGKSPRSGSQRGGTGKGATRRSSAQGRPAPDRDRRPRYGGERTQSRAPGPLLGPARELASHPGPEHPQPFRRRHPRHGGPFR